MIVAPIVICPVGVCGRLHLDIISLTSKVTLIGPVPRLRIVLRRRSLLVLRLRLLGVVIGIVLGLTVTGERSARPASTVEGLCTALTSASSADAAAEEEKDEECDENND